MGARRTWIGWPRPKDLEVCSFGRSPTMSSTLPVRPAERGRTAAWLFIALAIAAVMVVLLAAGVLMLLIPGG